MFKRKRVPLPQTLDGMDSFIKSFLDDNSFPNNQAYIGMVAMFIQKSGDADDTINTVELAKRVRRQVANEAAFYVIYPEKRAEYEKAKKEADDAKAAQTAQG